MIKAKDPDQYIASFPPEVQTLLQQLRTTIKRSAPRAQEVISYGMPAYKLDGMIAWFAGYAKHIGFYPGASGIAAFKNDLSLYKNAKGSVQFPLDKKLPLGLVSKIVKFKVKENLEKASLKKSAKKSSKKNS